MNFILDMLLLFIVLTLILIFNLPNLTSNNLLLQQIFIYFIITLYFVLQKIIIANMNKKKYNLKEIIKQSMTNAIPGLFGFILFTDLRLMDSSKDFIAKIINMNQDNQNNDLQQNLLNNFLSIFHFNLAYVVSLFIVLFTIFTKTFLLMFDVETYI
jgi:hypothetical protein